VLVGPGVSAPGYSCTGRVGMKLSVGSPGVEGRWGTDAGVDGLETCGGFSLGAPLGWKYLR